MIKLEPLQDNDIRLIEKWLRRNHVVKWYENPDSWIYEIKNRKTTFTFINHKIAYLDDIPIGFGQYYDCFYANEDWYTVDTKNTVYSIDYLIGEPLYLHEGYGKEIVNELVKEISNITSAIRIIVNPNPENIASVKTLLSAGFIYDEVNHYYQYLVKHE